MVKSLPATQETQEMWVRSLGQEDPLEEGMATHPSILAWRILWTEEPGGLQSMGSKESNTTEHTHTHKHGHSVCSRSAVSCHQQMDDTAAGGSSESLQCTVKARSSELSAFHACRQGAEGSLCTARNHTGMTCHVGASRPDAAPG